MELKRHSKRCLLLALGVVCGLASGCEKYLVFTTATKFGLDVSQLSDQPPKVALGYKREETILIPAKHANADDTQDTYAVLGYICVMANPSLWDFLRAVNPFSSQVPDGLQVRSVFTTGMAAKLASEDEGLRDFYKRSILQKEEAPGSDKNCL
jgi:hypothetical protein